MAGIEFLPTVKVLKAAQLLNAATEAEWTATNPVLPENMMVYAKDTGVIKIGNGTSKYSELPVYYTQGLANTIQHVRFVANIADRDALTEKNGLVVVYDTSADATVADNLMAGYVFDESSNEGAGAWVKIFERESMDVDLSGYFKKDTDTADSITDGVTKVMMTAAEREALTDLTANAVKYTDTIVLQGTNAAETAAMLQTSGEESAG